MENLVSEKTAAKSILRILLLGISAAGLLSLLLLCYRPFLVYNKTDKIIISHAPKMQNAVLFGLFVGFWVLFAIGCLLFLSELKPFFDRSASFFRKSRATAIYCLLVSLAFTVAGSVIAFIDARNGLSVENRTLAPLFVQSVLTVFYTAAAIFGEKAADAGDGKRRKGKGSVPAMKLVGCAFLLVFTVMTLLCCYGNIVRMTFTGSGVDATAELSGKDLLLRTDVPQSTEPLSFCLFAAIVAVCVLGALSILSVCSGDGIVRGLSSVTVCFDFLVIFAVGIFSKYYEIAIHHNLEKIIELYNSLNLGSLPDEYVLTVSGNAFWYIFAAAALAAALLIVKPFSRLSGLMDVREAVAAQTAVREACMAAQAAAAAEHTEDIPAADEDTRTEETAGEASAQPEEEAVPEPQMPEQPAPEAAAGEENFDNCPSFTEIDRTADALDAAYRMAKKTAFADLSLPGLVKFVVKYAAESRNHLSYSEESIASFVAGLGMSRLTILQGLSGTGKTSLPKIFTEALGGRCEIVEVESAWKDKHDLLGYYNEFTKVYSPKKFTQALYRAVLTPDVPVFIVLDEMNLSRIEYYFSDFLSLMENDEDKRFIRVLDRRIFNTADGQRIRYRGLYEDNTIKVPANVWFIGTANRDESTFEISDKVYDRANTMNFLQRAPKAAGTGEKMSPAFVSLTALSGILRNAAENFEFDAEKSSVVAEVEKLLLPFNISFGNRVMKQLESFVKVYCSCFDNKYARVDEAVEKFLLCKVVRKLEGKNLRSRQELVHGFEKLRLFECSAFVKSLGGDSFYD